MVCLSASNTWYGSCIRWITKSKVNHSFIAYQDDLWGSWSAVQIDKRGVVRVPVESVKYTYLECYEFTRLDLTTAMDSARRLVGDSYDWSGIFGFVLKIIAWRLLGRRILNPLHKKGELFCSEFVVTFLQYVDGMYDWIKVLAPDSVAPGGSDLGTPSLRYELQTHTAIKQVECPF